MAGDLFCVCFTTQCTQWAPNMATRLTLESEVMGHECLPGTQGGSSSRHAPGEAWQVLGPKSQKSLAEGAGLAAGLEIREQPWQCGNLFTETPAAES